MKCKILFVITVTALSGIFIAGFAYAGFWDGQANPTPRDTEQVRSEKRKISGSEMNFSYYTSSLDAEQVRDFYRNTFTREGWVEKEVAKDLEKVQGVDEKNRPGLVETLKNNLMFEKDGELIIVNFVPSGSQEDTKTRFTISRGSFDFAGLTDNLKEENFLPELATQPKNQVVPVYPGAKLISLNEKGKMLKAVYMSRDDYQQINSFYKDTLQQQGWNLADEKPMKVVDTGGVDNAALKKSCPACAAKGMQDNSIEVYFGELSFTNDKQDSCRIGFSRTTSKQNVPAGVLDFTNIMVDYVEK